MVGELADQLVGEGGFPGGLTAWGFGVSAAILRGLLAVAVGPPGKPPSSPPGVADPPTTRPTAGSRGRCYSPPPSEPAGGPGVIATPQGSSPTEIVVTSSSASVSTTETSFVPPLAV